MMFDAVDSDALGPTWEPSHQIEQFTRSLRYGEAGSFMFMGRTVKLTRSISVNTARGSDNIIVITDFREWVIQTGKESCYN